MWAWMTCRTCSSRYLATTSVCACALIARSVCACVQTARGACGALQIIEWKCVHLVTTFCFVCLREALHVPEKVSLSFMCIHKIVCMRRYDSAPVCTILCHWCVHRSLCLTQNLYSYACIDIKCVCMYIMYEVALHVCTYTHKNVHNSK